MALPHSVRRTFQALLPGSLRAEVDEELRFHLEMRERELVDAGMSPDAARREARRRFGDLRRIRAECTRIAERKEKTVRRSRRVEHLVKDLATAARGLRRRPAFTAAAVVTLALGLGVNTAVFQAVEALVLGPLPFPDSERLVSVSGTFHPEGRDGLELRAASYPESLDWRSGASSFDHLAAVSARPVSLTGGGASERVEAVFADPEYFDVLGVEPFLGRPLEAADNAPPAGLARAVVGHDLWSRRLDADRAALGRTLEIDGVDFEVVGVLPEGFRGVAGDQELWLPVRAGIRVLPGWDAEYFEDRGTRGLGVLGRLEPDASLERAQAELDAVSSRLQREHPDLHEDRGAQVFSLRERLLGDSRESSLLLFGAVALVWLVACVNVANLLLARLADRRRELAVRASLGATRGRLAVQVLAESGLLALLGGAAGLLLALWSRDLIAAGRPDALPPYLLETASTGSTVLYLAGLSLVTAFLTAAGPLAAALRSDPGRGLSGGLSRGPAGDGGGRLRLRGRRLLVAAEVAVTLVVLVGAALLVQSFRAQARIDPGFDADRVTAARIQLPERSYEDEAALLRFAEQLEERLAALPGVRRAALGSDVPLVSGYRATTTAAEDRLAEDPEHEIRIYYHRVTPGFFATGGIELQAGRTFEPPPAGADPETIGEEVVISRRLADAAWPGENPLGKHLLFGSRPPYTVVGVVEPVRYRALTPDPANPEDPDLYLPFAGSPPRGLALFVRTEPGMSVPPAAFRSLIAGLDPSLPLIDAAPLSDAVRTETAVARFSAGLFGLFGVLAAALALVGVYGVMAYSVVRRRREIGVRMALGAGRDRVIRQVLGDSAVLAAAGILAGLAAAWALSRLVASALYATEPTDPLTYGLVAAGLGATVLAACWIPALRAARTDPLRALESE